MKTKLVLGTDKKVVVRYEVIVRYDNGDVIDEKHVTTKKEVFDFIEYSRRGENNGPGGGGRKYFEITEVSYRKSFYPAFGWPTTKSSAIPARRNEDERVKD